MPTWVSDWLFSVQNIHKLFTVGRLPPWKIEDLEQHYKINLLSLTILFVLFVAVERVTSATDRTVFSNGYIYIAAIGIFLLAGIIVRLVQKDEFEARKLTNRWSTFFIISFAYALTIILGIAGLQWLYLRLGGQTNFLLEFDQLPIFQSDGQAVAAVSAIVTLAATLLLWTRTWRLFLDFRQLTPLAQVIGVVLAWALIDAVFWVATFVV